MTRWLAAAGLLAGFAALAVNLHWNDRVEMLVQEWHTPAQVRAESVWLPDYQVQIDGKLLPGMEDDEASDLTYNAATGTLFAVMGKHPFLTELTLEGDVLRKIPLDGWSNPEGVAALPNGQLAITDERQHNLTIVKVDASTKRLSIGDFPRYDLGATPDSNKGYEGIAWDPRHQRLVIGRERPAQLYAMDSDGSPYLTGEKIAIPNDYLDMRNLSALAVDGRTGHLLVLSAQSHVLLELDEKGKPVSSMSLLRWLHGLKSTIPRAEGVATDDAGNLYIVSEPNLFYKFVKAH